MDDVLAPLAVLAILAVQIGGIVAILWFFVTRELRQARRDAATHAVIATFGTAQAVVLHDPRQLATWYPLAEANRKLFPDAFAALDDATGARFPFSKEIVERAHARVSSEWLAWEKAHDEEYRLKAAAAEDVLARASGQEAALAKARLDRIQHEKIERYQQRYAEYVRDAKGLQALLE